MKYLLVFTSLIVASMAQRPTYAGISPKGYPELASRFKDPADTDDQDFGVANRIGADDQTPQNIPTDARGDVALVNKLNQWPRENRPFWLLNSDHIEKHRHPNGMKNNQQTNLQGQTTSQNQQQDATVNNPPTNERQKRQLRSNLAELIGY